MLKYTVFIHNCESRHLREDDYSQAQVVQKVDRAINQVNLYPVDSVISFPNTYPLDGDLSGG